MNRPVRQTGAARQRKGRSSGTNDRFAPVVASFAGDTGVTHAGGKGFGSDALKVAGKIFAMMSSRGSFVAKLPRTRVAELVSTGKAAYFDPGSGRLMMEWATIGECSETRPNFAFEARQFVGSNSQGTSAAKAWRHRSKR